MFFRRLFMKKKAMDCQPKAGQHETGDEIEKPMRQMKEETAEKLDDEQEYDEAKKRFMQLTSHGFLNMGSYADDVEVKMWLPEMNCYNVTVLCDKLLVKNGKTREGIIAITGEVFKHISILNLEQQSSGFRIVEKKNEISKPEVLLLKVSPEDIKEELIIPNKEYVWDGFIWGDQYRYPDTLYPFDIAKTTHQVPTSKYGHRFILNFSVSGEFGLDIYFIPKDGGETIKIFSKSFCCK